MTISLGNALKSVKSDEKWVTKTLFGGLFIIAASVAAAFMEMQNLAVGLRCLAIVLYLVLGILLSGYLVSTANKKFNTEDRNWAEWSEPNLLLKGLKFVLSYFVYTIVFVILFTLLGTVFFIIATILFGVIFYLLNLVLHFDQTALMVIVSIIATVLLIIFSLYAVQFVAAALVCYYKNLRFKDLMSFVKQYRIITENQHASWTLIGKFILFALLFALLTVAVCLTLVGVILVPFIVFASYIAAIDLYAQYSKVIQIERYLGIETSLNT